VSPILSNICLDRLDQFIEQVLLPAHNRGDRSRPYPLYMRCINGAPGLQIPEDVVRAKCAKYMRRGKALHLATRINDTD
jgi:hypothetical protein